MSGITYGDIALLTACTAAALYISLMEAPENLLGRLIVRGVATASCVTLLLALLAP